MHCVVMTKSLQDDLEKLLEMHKNIKWEGNRHLLMPTDTPCPICGQTLIHSISDDASYLYCIDDCGS